MPVRPKQIDTAAGTAHTNSTTEGALKTVTFAANELQPGVVHHITGFARITSSDSSDEATPRIRFGASATPASNTEVWAGTGIDAVDDDVVVWDLYVQATDMDTSSTVLIWGSISPSDASGTGMVSVGKVLTAVDLTAATYLIISLDWSVAAAANSARSETSMTSSLVN